MVKENPVARRTRARSPFEPSGGGPGRGRVFRQAGLLELVAEFAGSTRHVASLDRAARATGSAVAERFAAHYLYVFPMERGDQKPPMAPMAGARLHLGTHRWERVEGVAAAPPEPGAEEPGSAFIPEMAAVASAGDRRGERMRFYTQCASYAPLDSHYEFDPETDRWSPRPRLSDAAAERSGAVVVRLSAFKTVGDDLYVLGGVDGTFAPSAAVRRCRDGVWADVAPMRTARFAACAVAVGRAGLVVLGGYARTFGEGNAQSRSAERYDVAENAWRELPDLLPDGGDAREGDLLTAEVRGAIYAVEAHYTRQHLARVQRLAPGDARWSFCARLPTPPTGAARPRDDGVEETFATNVLLGASDTLLAMSGRIDSDDAVASSPVLIQGYDAARDEWSPLYEILDPALGFTALLFHDAVYFPLRGAREGNADGERTAIGCYDLASGVGRKLGGSTRHCDPRQGPSFVVGRAPERPRAASPAPSPASATPSPTAKRQTTSTLRQLRDARTRR
jgi:hypothetical protein